METNSNYSFPHVKIEFLDHCKQDIIARLWPIHPLIHLKLTHPYALEPFVLIICVRRSGSDPLIPFQADPSRIRSNDSSLMTEDNDHSDSRDRVGSDDGCGVT